MPVSILLNHPDAEVAEYGVTYEGCVLATREVNGYDDSDFVALCWDETEQKVVRVTYATTRCWTYKNSATVDAPHELRVRLATDAAVRVRGWHPSTEAAVRAEVVKGATVKVVAGRKYNGREGKVFWIGEQKNPYSHRPEVRVGVEDAEGRFFLPAEQVRVTVCPLPDDRVAREVAHRLWEALTSILHNDGIGITPTEVWHIVETARPAAA